MSNYGSDPNERLSRSYAPQRQAPRVPANIIRRPLMLPGHGLPMERVKDADGEIEIGFAPSVEPAPDTGMQRLLDRLRSGNVDQGVDVDAEPDDRSIPFCMACGTFIPGHEPGEPCPECHGDVYDQAE